MARKAQILVVTASAIAAFTAPLQAAGTPLFVAQAARSTDGIDGLQPPTWTPELGVGLTVRPSPVLLSWQASARSNAFEPSAADQFAEGDSLLESLEFPELRRASDDLIRYSAVGASGTSRPIIDPRDARPRTLNFDQLRGDRPTLAFFIPSAGTGTLLASAMLLGAPRRRTA